MKQFRIIRLFVMLTFLLIGLIGMSYAWFSNSITIDNNIDTGQMEYTFDLGSKELDITLDSATSNTLFHMQRGETYSIGYRLNQSGSGNVALKSIDNEYLGSINILRNSVTCNYNGAEITPTAKLMACIPDSLGSYDCYHSFDGTNGKLNLVKTSQPYELVTQLMKSDIGEPELPATASVEENITEITGEITENNNENTPLTKEKSKIKVKREKKLVTLGIINMEGMYGFEIPLDFNQYNAESD